MQLEYALHPQGPEVNLSGTQAELLQLGRQLLAPLRSFSIETEHPTKTVWPNYCKRIDFHLEENRTGSLLDISIQNDGFVVSGAVDGFKKLGQSLINFFTDIVVKHQHFHLDYIEGVPGLFAPTNLSLIVACNDDP